jgi:hypothetical protein
MIELVKGRTYWVEHKEHGTIKATLILTSENYRSLGFSLEIPYVLTRGYGNMSLHPNLLLRDENGTYVCLFTGDAWTIYDREPAVKIPTK